MAFASSEKNNRPDSPPPAASRSSWFVIVLALLVAALTAGGIAWYFTRDLAKNNAPLAGLPAPAQYFALEPAFVVNLNEKTPTLPDSPHYLQIEVQLMTRNSQALDALKTHAPAIRARLLLLFSQIEPAHIADRSGKEQLQAQALAQVQALMQSETGMPAVEELLFTSLITQ